MSISYPLTLPGSPAPRAVQWSAIAAVASFESPFTFQQQVQVFPGQIWRARIQYPAMPDTTAEVWIATLLSLNGREGSFFFGDSVRKTPRGSSGGTPLVNGASQTGQALTTDGWPVSVNGVLLKGDWIQLGSGATTRAYRVLADVNSDEAGNAIIDIWPRLRESPTNNDPLVLTNTKMTMKLADNKMDWDIDVAKTYGIEMDAVEAI